MEKEDRQKVKKIKGSWIDAEDGELEEATQKCLNAHR